MKGLAIILLVGIAATVVINACSQTVKVDTIAERFDMPKETVHNLQSELSKMYAGGGAIERMAEVYGNDREAMLAMVKKLREKKK